MTQVELREVRDEDLDLLFEFQQDPEANWMAAFTSKDPADRVAFDAHWSRLRASATIRTRTILVDGAVAGSAATFEESGMREVTYWVGRGFWGQGVATRALLALLAEESERPLRARVVHDNAASLRVLQKCGFVVTGTDRGFANARGKEVEEFVLTLP